MVSLLENFPPIIQALWGTGFTYLMTALGALGVFLGKELDRRVLNGMMGFAAGVMIAASYFSLLAPSIELSADLPGPIWLPAVGGFLLGGGFLWAVDKLLPHLHIGDDQPEGLRTSWQRNILLVFAITLHNIPEGLAVGVAFGAANAGLSGASLTPQLRLLWVLAFKTSLKAWQFRCPYAARVSPKVGLFSGGSSRAWWNPLLQ